VLVGENTHTHTNKHICLKEILAAEQRNKVVSKLHAILKPFVLRRLKSDVNISLPQKTEILLYATMSKEQKALNHQLLDGSLKVWEVS
jgi:ATP-dependent DNA helicase